jgi:anti-anti-sigma factor
VTFGRVEITSDDRLIVATVRGEVDLSNALAITDEIVEACGSRRLILDLSEVSYLDSSGVRMLFDLGRRCAVDDQTVAVLVPPGSPINKLLEVTHVGDVLTLISDMDELSPT